MRTERSLSFIISVLLFAGAASTGLGQEDLLMLPTPEQLDAETAIAVDSTDPCDAVALWMTRVGTYSTWYSTTRDGWESAPASMNSTKSSSSSSSSSTMSEAAAAGFAQISSRPKRLAASLPCCNPPPTPGPVSKADRSLTVAALIAAVASLQDGVALRPVRGLAPRRGRVRPGRVVRDGRDQSRDGSISTSPAACSAWWGPTAPARRL